MTNFQQSYSTLHTNPDSGAITVPIVLSSDVFTQVDILGKLDTGSSFCVFERKFAEFLELGLDAAFSQRINTATGSFIALAQEVTLSVFDYEWTTTVFFAESESFNLNILGRIGFLDHLRVGLVDYEQKLYCNMFDD